MGDSHEITHHFVMTWGKRLYGHLWSPMIWVFELVEFYLVDGLEMAGYSVVTEGERLHAHYYGLPKLRSLCQ